MSQKLFKLSPSDLTFLWNACKRCFYLKLVHNFKRPASPFPSIFSKIDLLMKDFFMDKPTSELTPELPPGIVQFGDRWIQSTPIELPGSQSRCYIRGKFDSVVKFDDGSYGVVDFKTSTPKPMHRQFYSRQLRAYAYALEHPAPGKFSLTPISQIGLLVVDPNTILRTSEGQIAYAGDVTWLSIALNEEKFKGFLGEVMTLLELPEPPEPGKKCAWCQYREESRLYGL